MLEACGRNARILWQSLAVGLPNSLCRLAHWSHCRRLIGRDIAGVASLAAGALPPCSLPPALKSLVEVENASGHHRLHGHHCLSGPHRGQHGVHHCLGGPHRGQDGVHHRGRHGVPIHGGLVTGTVAGSVAAPSVAVRRVATPGVIASVAVAPKRSWPSLG